MQLCIILICIMKFLDRHAEMSRLERRT